MADKIRVLLTEEEVDKLLKFEDLSTPKLCRQERSPDLYFKGWCIFYL